MKKFYVYRDNKQEGPFSTEELKGLKINQDTMIWFEGLDNWKKAIEIEDLKDIFKSIPPPFQSNTDKDSKENTNPVVTSSTVSKNTILIIALVVVVIGGYVLSNYKNQQANQAGIQRQLDEQNAKIKEQEKIEAARLIEEEKQKKAAEEEKRKKELESLKFEYDQAITNLRSAKIKLEEIYQFKLLRAASEKQRQIQSQLETIRSLENEVDRLEKEIEKY